MTLADLTALMSRVGRKNPALVQDRSVAIFIEACIEEARLLPKPPAERAPLAPVDFSEI